jgi:predicted enzyme related to lactoylglutathione lyase
LVASELTQLSKLIVVLYAFGATFRPVGDGAHKGRREASYVLIKNAGSANGGIMPMTEQHGDAPPYWLPYFTVLWCDGADAKVRELSGDALGGPFDVPGGWISVVRAPQGAAFAIFEGETDD